MNAPLGATVGVRRLLVAPTPDLTAHDQVHGPLPAPHDLIGLLRDAGLHGHGGAAFPTWQKLASLPASRPRSRPRPRGIDHVQHAGGRFARRAGIANRPQALRSSGESCLPADRGAIVVANGAEGEPASAKDRTLLRSAPHLVLDGLALVGAAVGATRAIVYVPSDLVPVLSRAVGERRVRDRIAVQVVEAPDTFVAGEETAVVSRLSGGPALPLDKFTRIVESGVDGRPTVLNNVETMAHIALIARHGAGWFRAAGTDADPGTLLVTVSGAVRRAGVQEHAYGETVGALLGAAGGVSAPLQAVLVGGYHGAWVPMPAAMDVAVSRESLAPYGAAPGAGVVVALPADACGLAATARVLDYLADQSARQCGPCQFGLPRLAETFRQLATVPRAAATPRLVEEVQRLAALVDGRGACRHPDGTVRLLRSALSTFRDDVTGHLSGTCVRGER